MGRGRAKAKQTRVARELKYQGADMDLSRLAEELRGTSSHEDAYDERLDERYSSYLDPRDEEDGKNRRKSR